MKRGARAILFLALAALAGIGASEAIYRSSAARQNLGRFCGVEEEISPLALNLRAVSESEAVNDDEIDRELNLLRDQFGDELKFTERLAACGLSLGTLRTEVTEHLRERKWIEQQIAPQLGVAPDETRRFYETHAAQLLQPQRYRANHLFLAAPAGSAPELIAEKQSAIQGLAVRLLAGEPLAQLIAEASEDGASKARGGDLGYFAAARMPSEFFAEVEKLQPGQVSAPFRSHLGFHLMQLSETKPPGRLSLEEAQPEIVLALKNEKRMEALGRLRARLSAE